MENVFEFARMAFDGNNVLIIHNDEQAELALALIEGIRIAVGDGHLAAKRFPSGETCWKIMI